MRDRIGKLVFASIASATVLACGRGVIEPPAKVSWATEIARNRGIWAASNVRAYRLRCHWHAMFVDEPPVLVSVERGSVVSVVDAETGETLASADAARLGKTVEEVFEILEQGDRRPRASIAATFDSQLGYPLRFKINWNRDLTDATEWAEFELQDAKRPT